jgi:hypothetical protein
VVVGWTNNTNGTYQSSSSQTVQVRVVDNLQTNDSITLYYAINISDCGDTSKWFSIPMSGTRGTSTTYSATINTVANNSGYCTRNGKEYVPYYVTGVDNATNSISVGGSISAYLANMTIDEYCGNSGKALAYCSYDEGWSALTTGSVNAYHEVHWATYQLNGASSLSSNYNISNVLNSIDSRFSYVYYRNSTGWVSYDPTQAWYLNTLRFANNTYTEYYINVTAAGVVIRIS